VRVCAGVAFANAKGVFASWLT